MRWSDLKSALKCDSFDVTVVIKIPFFIVSVTIELFGKDRKEPTP